MLLFEVFVYELLYDSTQPFARVMPKRLTHCMRCGPSLHYSRRYETQARTPKASTISNKTIGRLAKDGLIGTSLIRFKKASSRVAKQAQVIAVKVFCDATEEEKKQ
jgi:hypothetical protein